ncbi:MAG: cytoplasmic protein [Desulfobacterales bacterium]
MTENHLFTPRMPASPVVPVERRTFKRMDCGADAPVIRLRERSLKMLTKDLLLRNPLKLVGLEGGETLTTGGFGAVLARAGVGKTAFVVQIALNEMLRGLNILHISLHDPVTKVKLWYEEVFHHLTREDDVKQAHQLWETLLPHRFIMTFQVEGFSVPKLEERLTDLTSQNIFTPDMIIIDGMPFDANIRGELTALKRLAGAFKTHVWFTVRTHRHETPGASGVPVQLESVADLFEAALQLVPDGKDIHVDALIGGSRENAKTDLRLDPSTMLVNNGTAREPA